MPEQMSEQEYRELVSKDPLGYFSALHEQAVTQATAMAAGAKSSIAELSGKYLDIAVKALLLHSKELSIFRSLEVEMRNDIITPDSLKEYLGKLAAFREQVQAEAKARSSAKG